jgi:ribonuclease HII
LEKSLFMTDITHEALWIAGVDEAGRGPLAGPVFAAAVILDPQRPITGLQDSKKLSAKQRAKLFVLIQENAKAYAITMATEAEIDELNILQATLLAMKRAVLQLSLTPDEVWIDGNQSPTLPMRTKTIIQGDSLIPAISAASILAKESRDAWMLDLHAQYPVYGFDQHKGYPTALHRNALQIHGISPVHRRSFSPVKQLIEIA